MKSGEEIFMFKKNIGKKAKRGAIIATILLAAALTMGGCGRKNHKGELYYTNDLKTIEAVQGAPEYNGGEYGFTEGYEEEGYYDDYGVEYEAAPANVEGVAGELGDAPQGGEGTLVAPAQQGRKLIRTVDMQVETKEFDKLKGDIYSRISSLGGYIENEYSYNGSSYDGRPTTRYSNLVIRIPDDKLDEFVTELGDMANVVSKNSSATDVTLQYTDIESKRDMLRAEQESLTALLEKAESVEDIIYLTQRLTDVRYQIESLERQLRVFDNQVDYATVSLNVKEVEVLTPQVVEEKTPGEQIKEGFQASLEDVINSLKRTGMNFVIDLPYIVRALVILAIIAGAIFGVIKIAIAIIKKQVKKSKAKKEAAKAAAKAEEKTGKKSEKADEKTDGEEKKNAEKDTDGDKEEATEDKEPKDGEKVAESAEK